MNSLERAILLVLYDFEKLCFALVLGKIFRCIKIFVSDGNESNCPFGIFHGKKTW